MAGFGPAHEGVKVPCLTAWLHPCIFSHRLSALRSVWIAYTISRTEPGKHTALHNGLAQGQPLPHHFRIPFDEHASEFALHGSVRANHGTFQPCAGMSVASVSSFIAGASQIINSSTCRFHTAHRQAPYSGLTLPRRRNAVSTENWWFRQDLNLRIPPGAALYRLSYETMLRWAVRTHRATGKELKVKMASDTGGRRFLSRQLHSNIFRQVDTIGFSYFRNVLHKIPRPLFPLPPRGSSGIASRS